MSAEREAPDPTEHDFCEHGVWREGCEMSHFGGSYRETPEERRERIRQRAEEANQKVRFTVGQVETLRRARRRERRRCWWCGR